MKIYVTSVYVDDQDKALEFYTDVLGFEKKTEIPLGEARWLTVVPPDAPDGTELLLEPDGHPAVSPFKAALVEDGIPFTSFAVDDARRSSSACVRGACISRRSRSTSEASSWRPSTTPAAT